MKTHKIYTALLLATLALASCSKNTDPVANHVTLRFSNTFKSTPIVLGDAQSALATVHTAASGQVHRFSELKYVISNIRLVGADGTEFPYHINDLDKGATVVDQAKPQTLDYVLRSIPAGEYRQIKFGLGVRADLNTLDEVRFPAFYAAAGANDTDMHWQWAVGYRFAKVEGFYDTDHKGMTIHVGSTVNGTNGQPETYTQGVDAYRDITLDLPSQAIVGKNAPQITLQADFDKLLSGNTQITLVPGNATSPNYHSNMENMLQFVNNLGGDGTSDKAGMFTVRSVEN